MRSETAVCAGRSAPGCLYHKLMTVIFSPYSNNISTGDGKRSGGVGASASL
jgi:hypothetical protein